jgi:hypothetical protein
MLFDLDLDFGDPRIDILAMRKKMTGPDSFSGLY